MEIYVRTENTEAQQKLLHSVEFYRILLLVNKKNTLNIFKISIIIRASFI